MNKQEMFERHKQDVEAMQSRCIHTRKTKWTSEYGTKYIDCDWCGKTLKRTECVLR